MANTVSKSCHVNLSGVNSTATLLPTATTAVGQNPVDVPISNSSCSDSSAYETTTTRDNSGSVKQAQYMDRIIFSLYDRFGHLGIGR